MVDASAAKARAKPAGQAAKRSPSDLPPHAHCRICQAPIALGREPRVCGEDACSKEFEHREASERKMRMWMLIFFAIFALGYVGPVLGRLMGA